MAMITKIVKFPIFILMLSLIVLSCDIFEVGPNREINIKVYNRLKPIISWDGGPVHRLCIDDITKKPRKNIWYIYTPDSNNLYSPIEYGVIPDTAELLSDTGFPTDSLVLLNKYFIEVSMFPSPTAGYGSLKFVVTQN